MSVWGAAQADRRGQATRGSKRGSREAAARWFWDAEIFDFIAEHLHLFAQHSLRTYHHAWELKQAGLDWRHGVLSRCLQGAALEVAKLMANRAFTSEAERV